VHAASARRLGVVIEQLVIEIQGKHRVLKACLLLREELVLPYRWTCLQSNGDVLLVVREHLKEINLALNRISA
jgi:hypothetical protein